jgi:hypothetical protein
VPAERAVFAGLADDVPAVLVGVFTVSGLTEWERHRLADLERQLAQEDPEPAARLSRPVDAHPSWACCCWVPFRRARHTPSQPGS